MILVLRILWGLGHRTQAPFQTTAIETLSVFTFTVLLPILSLFSLNVRFHCFFVKFINQIYFAFLRFTPRARGSSWFGYPFLWQFFGTQSYSKKVFNSDLEWSNPSISPIKPHSSHLPIFISAEFPWIRGEFSSIPSLLWPFSAPHPFTPIGLCSKSDYLHCHSPPIPHLLNFCPLQTFSLWVLELGWDIHFSP